MTRRTALLAQGIVVVPQFRRSATTAGSGAKTRMKKNAEAQRKTAKHEAEMERIPFSAMLRALVLLGMVAAPAAADSPAPRSVHGDWVLIAGGGICQLRNTRVSARSGAVLLEMVLLPSVDGSVGALAGLRVPVGVNLRDGIAWRHAARPDQAVALAWQHCDAELCLAAGAISEAELDRLRRGNRIEVGFRPLPGADPVRMEVSLRGVTAGLRALERCAASGG